MTSDEREQILAAVRQACTDLRVEENGINHLGVPYPDSGCMASDEGQLCCIEKPAFIEALAAAVLTHLETPA